MNKLLEESLLELKAKNLNIELVRQLSSGKEATVYVVTLNDKLYALKVYKDYLTRSFKHDEEYLQGKYIRRASERKAILKKNKFGKNLKHSIWVKREFYILKKLFETDINIPEPIEITSNSILMEYLGDKDFTAPLLSSIKLDKEKAKSVYEKIVKDIDTMYENGIVHGDLSPFNILYWNEKPYIIDFPQSIDVRNNPNANEILKRDKENIINWYEKQINNTIM